jgi:hypothetical protein
MSAAPEPGIPGPPSAGGPRRSRKLLLAVGAALVAAVLVVVAVVLGSRDDGGTTDAAASSSPARTSSTPAETTAPSSTTPSSTTPEPAQPAVADGELPPALPAVALDQPVVVDEVTATLPEIEEITGQATGPGDVAGPALRVTVRIQNGTQEAIALDEVSVNAYYRADLTPAPPLNDPSALAFFGPLPAGEAAEAVYVFRVPPEQRGQVTLEVGYRPGAPLAIFSGAV